MKLRGPLFAFGAIALVFGALAVGLISAQEKAVSGPHEQEKTALQQEIVNLKEKVEQQKVVRDLQKERDKLKEELGEKKPSSTGPGFVELIGAFAAFGALLLVLSIVPEKLTDAGRNFFYMDKKDSLADLFGWPSYSQVLQEPDLDKLKTAYRILYDAIEANVAGLKKQSREQAIKQGLSNSQEIEAKTLSQVRSELVRLDLRMVSLEGRRVIWLRIASVGFGIIFCALLQIDAFLMLSPIMPDTIDQLLAGSGKGWFTPGISLTGVGAGMGSAFWHDFLDRLTKAKEKVTKEKVKS